jgi:enoyl-CoA hydratase/carnithine racemase
MNKQYRTLKIAVSEGVATVTLDNPPINLLDAQMRSELESFAADVRVDESVRVIVFQSADPEFFISHSDAGPFVGRLTRNPAVRLAELGAGYSMREAIAALPQATIGKIEGRCRGGGSEFALALDMRFAALGRAVFSQFEVAVGCLPGGGATQRLPHLLGRARALEVILGCDDLDARRAAEYNYVNAAMEQSELGPFVDRLAARIASFPGSSIKLAKEAVRASDRPLAEGLLEEQFCFAQSLSTDAAHERFPRFLEMGAQTRDVELQLADLLPRLGQPN